MFNLLKIINVKKVRTVNHYTLNTKFKYMYINFTETYEIFLLEVLDKNRLQGILRVVS